MAWNSPSVLVNNLLAMNIANVVIAILLIPLTALISTQTKTLSLSCNPTSPLYPATLLPHTTSVFNVFQAFVHLKGQTGLLQHRLQRIWVARVCTV